MRLTLLIQALKGKPGPTDEPLTFKDFHSIRYTFVNHLFEYYGQNDAGFTQHLKGLKAWYIWNIYRQLSCDILDKAAELRYQDIEQNFKQQIVEKLKVQIRDKIPSVPIDKEPKQANEEFRREINF